MFEDEPKTPEKLDFREIGDLVADSLIAGGYRLMRMETQEWAVQYSLDCANIDGSAVVFFGPAFRRGADALEIPYLVVGPETRRGEVHLLVDADSGAAASALLSRFHEILTDLFQTVHWHDSHVGVGLVPVDGRPGSEPSP